ncbi:MAG: dethiobiotin synthase [Sedimentisphaerales bacterium]|nr:dethiobiotin synthase [Sedimentisphaerales bacterium]
MTTKNREKIAELISSITVKNGIFITGTDTGVGKTLVTGAIAWCLRKSGLKTGVFKPVATGCEHRREGLVSRDAEFLSHCSDSELPLSIINPVTYSQPLAPWMAAQKAGQPINWQVIADAYRQVVAAGDVVLVEGIGGAMVPLERDFLVLDLMAAMQLPALIVARAGLGTINHTLLTVEVCRKAGLEVMGIVINGYNSDSTDESQESNPRVLRDLTGLPVLSVIPYEKDSCVEKGLLGVEVLGAVRLANWVELIEKTDH